MEAPTDRWEWDAESGEVVALDASDKRGGEAIPVDFSDEPVGILAAAAPDMARALEPLARFVAAFDAKPIRGIDDVLYGIHGGSEHEAEIRLSDLRKAVSALRKAGVL